MDGKMRGSRSNSGVLQSQEKLEERLGRKCCTYKTVWGGR